MGKRCTVKPMSNRLVNRSLVLFWPQYPETRNYIKPSLATVSSPSPVYPTKNGISVRPCLRYCHPRADFPTSEVRRRQHCRLRYIMCFMEVVCCLIILADFGCGTDGTCIITEACPPLTQLGCKMVLLHDTVWIYVYDFYI